MNPTDHPEPEDLGRRAARILQAIDDTPIAAIDAIFYAHYFEELRLLVEDLLAHRTRCEAAVAVQAWLVWNCTDLVDCYPTEAEALEAQADLRQQIHRDYGSDPELQESITITTATLQPLGTTPTGRTR
ncbi:hypothetical protein [Serinicoccus marinus]|uniref:hypothetical protein n=1 Tax=Serinicoccus marinus TaxID=247333 RepID=UPI002492398C|nr:hypothetical protein [Serinicoccus marinus]